MFIEKAGTLLWMTHALLQEHGWTPPDLESGAAGLQSINVFSGDVNLLPARCYKVPKMGQTDTDVHVRALVVGTKLFVHFVSIDKSVRISLTISEFVKPRGPRTDHQRPDEGQVLCTDKWRGYLEILRWRLQRNLFPEFSSNRSVVPSDAELNRLPEQLLVRIGTFLTALECCRVAGTSKYIHLSTDSFELWQHFLLRDYGVALQSGGDTKATYVRRYTDEKRMEVWNQQDRERRLSGYMQRQQAQRRGRLAVPLLWGPMPPLFAPSRDASGLLRPPHMSRVLDDEDLGLPFDIHFDSMYPNFN
uniref:F-box domain-containing protein n=1 Tax=Peronospora matthiolae TaxID=2874970 RepID=A0AAV1TQ83_9STRA